MTRKAKNKIPMFLWSIIFLFLVIVISFPKWIMIFYPLPHSDIVFSAAQEYNVDPYLVFAIIRAESKYQTAAESPVGAKGLMQIMPDTAQWIAGQIKVQGFKNDDLHKPEVNIRFGCWYLRNLSDEFKGNLPLMVASYNAGRGKVKQWIHEGQWDGNPDNLGSIPFAETRQYVKNVMQNYEAYKAIYDRVK
ncbi:MAG: lytic transglycosylase domain-containing protein [Syntrophomonas sp.]|nr:lytic transglycosylase domain-containing protein [Syntrophomonas sp.]